MPHELTPKEKQVVDETLPHPPKRPLRKLWGSILFVLSLGFWKGN